MLTIVRNRSWSFDLTVFDVYLGESDPGNEPTNHSGWTIRSQIRTKVGNRLIANLNVTFPVPTAGTVAIRHTREFTRSLPVGDYWWDIVATDGSGNDFTYVEPEPIAVRDHPTDPADTTYDFVPGGGGVINHTHVISDINGLEDRLPPEGGTIARYLRGDNTWQLLNKASVGLGNVENTKLSTWTGSSAITTVGTVAAGVWQGTVIAPAYLGTGSGITTKFLRGDGTWQTVSGSVASTGITDSTVTGRALITAADQATARAALGAEATGDLLFTAENAAAAKFALGVGATGDALFTAATPAAARETALNEILKYAASAAAARTNPTFADDDVLADINLTAGLWEISFYFAHDAGTCGVQARFRFGTPASVDAASGSNYGFVQRGNQAIASLSYGAATGTLTANAATTAITNWHHTGQMIVRITGATTLAMQYQYGTSVAGQTITRLGGAFLRARKING